MSDAGWERTRRPEKSIGQIITVEDGKFRPVGPGAFQRWVMEQHEVWVDRAGKVYLIDDMSPRYVLNVVKFLCRRSLPEEPWEAPIIQGLMTRLQRAGTPDQYEEAREALAALSDPLPMDDDCLMAFDED